MYAFHFPALYTKVYEDGLVQKMSERAGETPALGYFLSNTKLSKGALGVNKGSEDSAVEVGIYKLIFCVTMSCVAWYCSIHAFVAHCHYGKQALCISHFVGVSVFLVYAFFFHPCVPPTPPTSEGLRWF